MSLQLAVTDFKPSPRLDLLDRQLLAPLQTEFETVDIIFDPQRTQGEGYYQDICFHIYATSPSGKRMELVDGGVTDWTQIYLSNAKERLVISGIGSERLCTEFDQDKHD
ncbi:MAG: hypothetical protein P1S60_12690 [Anaerolineae bacterium]|nr:hypothetical protein [Anaerolineae bacterium]